MPRRSNVRRRGVRERVQRSARRAGAEHARRGQRRRDPLERRGGQSGERAGARWSVEPAAVALVRKYAARARRALARGARAARAEGGAAGGYGAGLMPPDDEDWA